MSKIHYFDSTGDAYDACQCDDSVKKGDTLLIENEKVVGVAETWPFAVTEKAGKLHGRAEGISWSAMAIASGVGQLAVDSAISVARARGWAVQA